MDWRGPRIGGVGQQLSGDCNNASEKGDRLPQNGSCGGDGSGQILDLFWREPIGFCWQVKCRVWKKEQCQGWKRQGFLLEDPEGGRDMNQNEGKVRSSGLIRASMTCWAEMSGRQWDVWVWSSGESPGWREKLGVIRTWMEPETMWLGESVREWVGIERRRSTWLSPGPTSVQRSG